MQGPSTCFSTITVLLLCFIGPLQSDPQQSYWPNYEAYDPRSSSRNPVVFPEQFHAQDIQQHPPYTLQYEGKPFVAYRANYFQGPPVSSGYLDRTPETKYLSEDSYYDYQDFVPSRQGQEELKEDRVNLEEIEDPEDSFNDEKVLEKMRILDKLLSDEYSEKDLDSNGIEDKIMPEETKRVAREIRKQKPGFFWTLARITFESINDTSSAIKRIGNIITNTIVPDSATDSSMSSGSLTAVGVTTAPRNMTNVNTTETTTTSPTTTTQMPLTLTVSSLRSLIRRNVLGLVRLFNIEWKDALNQSEISVEEFRKTLGRQVGSYLRDNPNAY